MKKSIGTFFIALVLTGVFAPLSFSVVRAQDQSSAYGPGGTQAPAPANPTTSSDVVPDCGFGGALTGGKDSSMMGCVADIIYGLIYKPSFLILTLTAYIFDWGISYSIKNSSYTNPFIENGWGIVRDISNIFFIFVLLWIAIGLMLGLHSVHPKKDIATVIIIALIINFSLFITRVVVDSGNILSYLFYNSITIQKAGCTPADKNDTHCDIKSEVTGDKSLSTKIAASVNITKLIGDANLHPGVAIPCSNTDPDCPPEGEFVITGGAYAGHFLFITLIASVFNLVLAWTLFLMAFLFIGRVVTIWIAMIFAPFAFVSYTVPGMGKLPTIGNKSWWADLIGAVFFAPVFLFFLYLILQFLSTGISSTLATMITSPASLFGKMMAMLIPFMIIIGLIFKAKAFAVKMAGETAAMFMKVGTAAGGLALGAATGGASLAMQRTIGASATAKLKDEDLKDAASGKISADFRNRAGYKNLSDRQMQEKAAQTLKTAQSRSSRSFDFRQTGIGQQMSNATGMNMGSFGGLATGRLAGGVEGAANRKAEKDRKFAEMLGENPERKAALEKSIKGRKDNISSEEDKLDKSQEALARAKTPANGGKDPITGKSISALEKEVQGSKDTLRDMRKGSGIKAAVGDTLADGRKATAEDVKRGALTQDGASLEGMEKALENNKKARAKEYYHTQMKNTGYNFKHDETGDAIGNIKEFGHLDTGSRSNARKWGKDILNSMKRGAMQVGGSGALLGAFAGPMGVLIGGVGGAIVGSIKGAVSGGALPGMQELFSKAEAWATRENLQIAPLNIKLQSDLAGTKILADASHIASDESHKIHTYQSKYKSPSKGFFSMFEGLAKPPSGGGGGDDHGGGGGGHH